MKIASGRTLARLRTRVVRRCLALLRPGNSSNGDRVLESFLPTGHLYGIDYGNIDPAWYRAK